MSPKQSDVPLIQLSIITSTSSSGEKCSSFSVSFNFWKSKILMTENLGCTQNMQKLNIWLLTVYAVLKAIRRCDAKKMLFQASVLAIFHIVSLLTGPQMSSDPHSNPGFYFLQTLSAEVMKKETLFIHITK